MTDLETEEPLSSLSDSSFVVLGQASLSFQANYDSYKEPNNLSSTSNCKGTFSHFGSSNTDISDDQTRSIFSEETIQKKLNDLVKENHQLKETLSQNNLAIKSQLGTFFMWQQEILKAHETIKQKFLETKELILKLRAENSSLKKQLQDSLVGHSVNDVEIYAQVNKKHKELDKWEEKAKEYERMYNDEISENENLNMKILKLCEELKTAKGEILKLSKELEDLGRDNTYLKQRNNDFSKNTFECLPHRSLPNSEARAQISNLLKQLDEEKSKVLKLKEKLKKIQFNYGKTSGSALSTTEELNQYIDNLNDMTTSLNKQNQRFNSLQSWVSLAEESLKDNEIHTGVECNLMCEMKELKTHLNQEENASREKQETLMELKEKFTTLLEDYRALQLKLNSVNEKNTNIEKYSEEISSLSAKLDAKDNYLKLKEQECNNLKEEMEKLNLTFKEEVTILRFQVKIYQDDFNEERSAREKLVGEKEDMAKQVRHLQSELEALVKEKENPNKKDVSETSSLESTGKKTTYRCPKCNFSYSDLQFCQDHVEECLATHFYP